MVFMRREVGDINGVVIKLLAVRGSALGSSNTLKLHGELPYLLLESDNGIVPSHFVSLFRGQVPLLGRFSFIGYWWNWVKRKEGNKLGKR